MKKLLVLGSTGMAGHLITIYFVEKGYDVTALSTTPFPYGKNIICDVFEEDKFSKFLLDGNYDAIINCIGLLNQVAEDYKDKAVYLNSYLSHHICNLTKNMKTKYIHMSTDCVFSGKMPSYSEYSFRDGETFYDRTKALGEINDLKNLTFRNSIIGPDMNINGIGLFNWFMKQKGEINGYDGIKWTGVTTLTLAKAMEVAINSKISGIYNLVNNQSISKYEMLVLFNDIFDRNTRIKKTNDINVSKILVNSRQSEFSFTVPSYKKMILEMSEWVNSHKELYKHYFN